MFKFNYLALCVQNLPRSFFFYNQVLGIAALQREPQWARLNSGGAVLELFGGGLPPAADRAWGRGQSARPSLQVADLEAAHEKLNRRMVAFVSDTRRSGLGEAFEFIAPESFRWTLARSPRLPWTADLSNPYLGWVELKAFHMQAQVALFRDVFGLSIAEARSQRVAFIQPSGAPLLIVTAGGEQHEPVVEWTNSPHLLGFETEDIDAAAELLKSRGIQLLREVTHLEDGSVELIALDADGFPLKIYQPRTV